MRHHGKTNANASRIPRNGAECLSLPINHATEEILNLMTQLTEGSATKAAVHSSFNTQQQQSASGLILRDPGICSPYNGRLRSRIACSGIPIGDKVHPSRGYLAFPCHAPLQSPGAGRLKSGEKTLWFLVKAKYVDELGAILRDPTRAGLEAFLERISPPGVLSAVPAKHPRPMMTTWGGILLKEEMAYLVARGYIKNIRCLTPDGSNEFVVVGVVFRESLKAALAPGVRVMVPRCDVQPYVSTPFKMQTRDFLKEISRKKAVEPGFEDDNGYALLPDSYPDPEVTEYQGSAGCEDTTILLWREADLDSLAICGWQELASQVLRLSPSLQLNCGAQCFPVHFAFYLEGDDEIAAAKYVDEHMPRPKKSNGRNRSGHDAEIRYGNVPRLWLPENVPLVWPYARVDYADWALPPLEPAVTGGIDRLHQSTQGGGVPSLQAGPSGNLPGSLPNTGPLAWEVPGSSLGNSGGQGSTDGSAAPPQAAPDSGVAALYKGWKKPDAPEGRFASPASLAPLATDVAAVMPLAPSLMEPAQEGPLKRTRLASSSAKSDLDGSFTQMIGGFVDFLDGELEECRNATFHQDEDHQTWDGAFCHDFVR